MQNRDAAVVTSMHRCGSVTALRLVLDDHLVAARALERTISIVSAVVSMVVWTGLVWLGR